MSAPTMTMTTIQQTERESARQAALPRFDEIAHLAKLAASYWASIMLAAQRGETLTARVHLHQAIIVTCPAAELIRELGEEEPAIDQATSGSLPDEHRCNRR
jgi:hypothetical protein